MEGETLRSSRAPGGGGKGRTWPPSLLACPAGAQLLTGGVGSLGTCCSVIIDSARTWAGTWLANTALNTLRHAAARMGHQSTGAGQTPDGPGQAMPCLGGPHWPRMRQWGWPAV